MLTVTTEYALRALAHLAAQPQGEPMRSHELAQRTGIPASYLAKVLHTLRSAGFLAASRGIGGGYTLVKPPSKIRLIDVAVLFEGARAMPHCLLDSHAECSEKHPCAAHERWKSVRQSLVDFLQETTLLDIARPILDASRIPNGPPALSGEGAPA